jgi:hypothetical protein
VVVVVLVVVLVLVEAVMLESKQKLQQEKGAKTAPVELAEELWL